MLIERAKGADNNCGGRNRFAKRIATSCGLAAKPFHLNLRNLLGEEATASCTEAADRHARQESWL